MDQIKLWQPKTAKFPGTRASTNTVIEFMVDALKKANWQPGDEVKVNRREDFSATDFTAPTLPPTVPLGLGTDADEVQP